MTSAKAQPTAYKNNASVHARYLELLGASTVRELEERVVGTLLESMASSLNRQQLPIKLSKVAHQFSIEPKPEFIPGTHDGEIHFDPDRKRFVIKLCTKGAVADRRRLVRERFTYAHEMAHRFFFVQREQDEWSRAIDLLTSELPEIESMKARRRLNAVEETLCNRIAQRVLMPDPILRNLCSLPAWWHQKDGFYGKLRETAQRFHVSRECLLVGISSAIRRQVLHPPDGMFLMVIGRNRGPLTNRGKEALRISIGIFPRALSGCRIADPFPGFELRRFGVEAENSFSEVFEDLTISEGDIEIPLSFPISGEPDAQTGSCLQGHWRSFNTAQHSDKSRKLLVWGTLITKPHP